MTSLSDRQPDPHSRSDEPARDLAFTCSVPAETRPNAPIPHFTTDELYGDGGAAIERALARRRTTKEAGQ